VSWHDAYRSPLQSVWGLTVGPVLFLVWLALAPRPARPGADPAAARVVRVWALVFAAESIADATLPALAGVPMLLFVLLGDWRVFVLVEALSAPDRPLGRHLVVAAAWTLVVPLVTAVTYLAVVARGAVSPGTMLSILAEAASSQALWLVYEVAFSVLALVQRGAILPRRRPVALRYLRAVWAWVIGYYVLWACADMLILAGDDRGWLLRMLPNQLYYGLFVPFAYLRFFASSPESAATRSLVQACR